MPNAAPAAPTEGLARALDEALRAAVGLLRWLVLALAVAYAFSGWFVVGHDEVAVPLRFGVPGAVQGPGLHLTWPRPIGEVVRVPVGRPVVVRTDARFWWAPSPEERMGARNVPPPEVLRPEADGYLLAADRSLLHARWSMTCRIVDPARYAFTAEQPAALLQAVLAQTAAQAVITVPASDLLEQREAVAEQATRLAADRVAHLALGLRVEAVTLDTVQPPRQVTDAFDAAAEAGQLAERAVADARAKAQQRETEAAGVARRREADARAKAAREVQSLAALADAFTQVLPEYRRDPAAFRRREHRRAVQEALARAGRRLVLGADGAVRLEVSPPPRPAEDAEATEADEEAARR